MDLRTIVKQPSFPLNISYNDHIMSIGSCFAEHMAARLASLKYHIISNPTGITFNPASLLTTIKSILSPNSLLDTPLNHHNGMWSHPHFHSSFSHTDKKKFINNAQDSLLKASNTLSKTKVFIITIGTSFVYKAKATGQIVNNCHKIPASDFTKELLKPTQTYTILHELFTLIKASALPNAQLVFTLSPVRHIKNGLTLNHLSKANALVAIHQLVSEQDQCHYFPSYEIMMDDLRDYRYYNEDLIHPSPLAKKYIFEIFEKSLFEPKEQALRTRITKLNKRSSHKALFPDSEQNLAFQKKLKEDIVGLYKSYPFLA